MKKILLLCAAVLVLFPALASASTIPVASSFWTGSRSTDVVGGLSMGLKGTGGWSGTDNDGFKIAWVIVQDETTKEYTYTYTLSNASGGGLIKQISHWILEVTDPSEIDEFTFLSSITVEGPTTWSSGGSNPNMPSNIYGIKWDPASAQSKITFSFTTSKDPVWGDFYAKNGTSNHGTISTTVWNTGFGTTSDPTTNQVLRPNGGEVPIPGAVWLLGSGLLGLVGIRRKRDGRKA